MPVPAQNACKSAPDERIERPRDEVVGHSLGVEEPLEQQPVDERVGGRGELVVAVLAEQLAGALAGREDEALAQRRAALGVAPRPGDELEEQRRPARVALQAGDELLVRARPG